MSIFALGGATAAWATLAFISAATDQGGAAVFCGMALMFTLIASYREIMKP